jgi:anti-sigma B factor antagonist
VRRSKLSLPVKNAVDGEEVAGAPGAPLADPDAAAGVAPALGVPGLPAASSGAGVGSFFLRKNMRLQSNSAPIAAGKQSRHTRGPALAFWLFPSPNDRDRSPMHISVEPRDDYAILHLRGEFDTFYVPLLQEEIDALVKAGIVRVVLNLRLVKFINSTALGAMIKASKQLSSKGGKLVIERPSAFCRDIIQKVGLDRVIGVFDSDDEAAENLMQATARHPKLSVEHHEEHPSTVLFSPVDSMRIEHFLPENARTAKTPLSKEKTPTAWSGAGRMSAIDVNGLRFTWNGGSSGLSSFAMGQFLAIGTDWRIKFRLPLFQKGYCEAICVIKEIEERPDGVKVGAAFKTIDNATREAIKQLASDMAFLKDELRKATDT